MDKKLIMPKGFRRFLIIISVLIGIILLDSMQALLFNNNPIIGIQTKCMRKDGILVSTYHCGKNKYITKLNIFKKTCDSVDICNKYLDNGYIQLKKDIIENLDNMLKVNNGISSNPYDYINNVYFDNIISFGDDAIVILVNMYYNNELNGLKGYLSAIVIESITNCSIRNQDGNKWATVEEFYLLWENQSCHWEKSKKNFTIVDKSEEMDDFVCATAIEPFYEDDDYIYSFSCIKSDLVVVRYDNGQEEKVKDALKSHEITINDLDKFNIHYYKDVK